MNKFIVGATAALLGGVGLKVYGKYKYHCGKCDAHNDDKVLINMQHSIIRDLLWKVEYLEETR